MHLPAVPEPFNLMYVDLFLGDNFSPCCTYFLILPGFLDSRITSCYVNSQKFLLIAFIISTACARAEKYPL